MHHQYFACPVCSLPLELHEQTWKCQSNHSFDAHKKGYVNLLLAQDKKSKAPGDDRDMIMSRRRFLEGNHYLPLAEMIAQDCKSYLNQKAAVLDAGCGEGYYTAILANKNPSFTFFGLDISKPAIVAACKYKNIHWCVASSTRAPFLESKFNAIISIFSRIDPDSFSKILSDDGLVCVVAPDHDHLMTLRSEIYSEVRPYDTTKHLSYLGESFTLISEKRLEIDIEVASKENIQDLVGMTPHAHHLSNDAKARLSVLDKLIDQACFKIYWFQKKSNTTTTEQLTTEH